MLSRNANRDMNEVFPGLYIGNQRASAEFGSYFDMVVNCTPSVPFAKRPLLSAPGVRVRVAIDDHPNFNPQMLDVARHSGILEQMHDMLSRNQKVLVHCHAGMQRSCAMVAFYLMKYYKLSLSDTMNYIKQYRPIAFFGGATFMPAMQEFERTKDVVDAPV